jgi:hypothetical protein
MSPTTAATGKSNSFLGEMLMHTTYYRGVLAPIPEGKASWDIW